MIHHTMFTETLFTQSLTPSGAAQPGKVGLTAYLYASTVYGNEAYDDDDECPQALLEKRTRIGVT